MQYNLSAFFAEYENLVREADRLFDAVKKQCPEEVTCVIGCCDCCYAMFDLTLVEAMYINEKFQEHLDQETRREILEQANRSDRQAYKVKWEAYKSRQKGEEAEKVLEKIGRQRIRCPLLDAEDRCLLYAFRPITCRVYGLPLQIGGEVHTCSLSGFTPGKKYPTVFMDKIQDRLLDISQRLVQSLPTKHTKLSDVLVPLSMALLTEYDDNYLGIVEQVGASEAGAPVAEWTLGSSKGEAGNG